ncbi:MAG: type IV pilus assembly protein PilM [Bdellovibrionales bacterium]|nr:type IV pilus assembly protein PilM [Bdellovibrionales bacterium]
MLSFFGNKKIIGIDIGSSSIKIAELDVGKKGASLLAFGIVPTPPHSVSGGDISDTAAIGSAIRELVDKLKTKRKNVAIGLGGTSVIVKRISIPKMDEKLISEQIRWEAEQYIPYEINEVNLGHQILRKSAGASDSLDILLIAAVQSHVFKYAEAVAIADLNCSIVDVSGFALVNCFKANYGEMPGQTIALLNIGASASTMVVVENTEAVFCRDIPVGGLNYTIDLHKTLNMSIDEAEAIKLGVSTGQPVPDEANKIIEATHDVVCEEIKASFDFFLNTAHSQNVSRCFLTGGGAKSPGLIDQLSKIVPCEKLDPFFSVKVNSKDFSKDYINQIRDFSAVAIGLGLRQIGDE